MWKRFAISLLLLATTLFTAQSPDQPEADRARIVSLENAWNQALRAKDGAALRMLLAPDLIYVEQDGTMMNKTEYMASIDAPGTEPVHITNDAMQIHNYGVFAVVTGRCSETGIKNGKPYAVRVRFTDTWIHRGNSWECVASQSTTIAH